MRWAPLAIVALFLGPLWATGELGVWSFSEPRSHLRWDEAMGQAPQPLDEHGGPAMLGLQLLAGAALALCLALWARRSP